MPQEIGPSAEESSKEGNGKNPPPRGVKILHCEDFKITTMTQYHVQFTLPVDNPVSNVARQDQKDGITFFVPINHPEAHNMGFMDLVVATKLSGLFKLSPTHNKNNLSSKDLK